MRTKKHWLRSAALVMATLVALYFVVVPLLYMKVFEFGFAFGNPTEIQSAAMHSLTPMAWLSERLPIYERYVHHCMELTMEP